MKEPYLTLRRQSQGVYREKGSKFLSFAFPVENELEATEQIDRLKKEYHDARHHCYAYTLGREGKITRTSDAGEPKHTAGDPILNRIRSFGLSDVLVVVVRYFGGTKLGKSGLIQAYKKATDDALEKQKPIKKLIYKEMKVDFDYGGLNEIMRLIDQHNLKILDQTYQNQASIIIRIKESDQETISELFSASPHVINIEISPG